MNNLKLNSLIPIVEAEMKSQGLNQKTLAAKSGLRESIISKFLNDANKSSGVSLKTISKIALGLGKSLLYFIERSDYYNENIRISMELPFIEFAKLQYLVENHKDFQNSTIYTLLKQFSITYLLNKYDNIKKEEKYGKLLLKSVEMFNEYPSSSSYALSLSGLEKNMMNYNDIDLVTSIKRYLGPNHGELYKIFLVNNNEDCSILVDLNEKIGIKVFINETDKTDESLILNPDAGGKFYSITDDKNDTTFGYVEDKKVVKADLKLFLKLLRLDRTKAYTKNEKEAYKLKEEAINSVSADISMLEKEFGDVSVDSLIPVGFIDAYTQAFNKTKDIYITSMLDLEYNRNITYLRDQCSREQKPYYVDKFIKGNGTHIIYFSNRDFSDLEREEKEILTNYLNMEKGNNVCIYYLKNDSIPPPLFTVDAEGTFGIREKINGDNIIVGFNKVYGSEAKILKRQFEELKLKSIKLGPNGINNCV